METPGNHESQWTSFMTQIVIWDNYIPSSLGTLMYRCALEKEEVMGGTVHDTPLHERAGTAVADRTSLINPDLSLIPSTLAMKKNPEHLAEVLCNPGRRHHACPSLSFTGW